MDDKFHKSFKTNKAILIVGIVLFLLLAIFVVPGFTGVYESGIEEIGTHDSAIINYMIDNAINYILNPIKSFAMIFKSNSFGTYISNLVITTAILFISLIIGVVKAKPKHGYKDIEHGSADWSEGGEQYKILDKKNGIRLAENNFLPLNKRGNINVLVVGGSGSGKSASYSIPNAYQKLGSYVFTDPKGELYDQTAGYLKENGYKIKVLNLVNPELSDGYNPLAHIFSEIDVDVISQTIVKGQSESKSDPFWEDNAQMLLKALIYYLIAKRPPEEQNLASCAELVRAASTSGDSSLLSRLINTLPANHPARTNFKSVELASDKTFSSILSTLQSKLGKFDSKEIASLTSTDTIDFEQIGNEKVALYVISPDTHSAYDFILTIFFSQMIQQLYDYADKNGGALKEKVFFILDEFANIGQIPDFDKKISTSRSRNISFSVILQNVDQLEAVYEKSYETIMGNCDTHLFLGSNSFKTLEYFSKSLGEKTISRDSMTINKDKENHLSGKSYSDSVSARALMTPDELRRMDVDDCIIFVKGIRPVKAKKFYYFNNSTVVNQLKSTQISHNDFEVGQRGEWRVFDPNNPYKDKKEEVKNLDLLTLDGLFDNEETNKSNANDLKQNNIKNLDPKISDINLKERSDKNKNNNFDLNFNKGNISNNTNNVNNIEKNTINNNSKLEDDFYKVNRKDIYADDVDQIDLQNAIENLFNDIFDDQNNN